MPRGEPGADGAPLEEGKDVSRQENNVTFGESLSQVNGFKIRTG